MSLSLSCNQRDRRRVRLGAEIESAMLHREAVALCVTGVITAAKLPLPVSLEELQASNGALRADREIGLSPTWQEMLLWTSGSS